MILDGRSITVPYGMITPSKSLIKLALKAGAKALWYPNRQVATNSPLTTVLTDYTDNGNSVTLTNLAGTTSDGYENTPFISDIGNEVRWTNLLGNEGNMIDSNADNRADGWNYASSTAISCSGNEVVFLPTANSSGINKVISGQSSSDVLYLCGYVKASASLVWLAWSGANLSQHSGTGSYQFLSYQGSRGNTSPFSMWFYSTASSGFSNISVKQAHLFNLTTMFPDPANRPTQEQMDRLVQQAISIYGYVNDVHIKILWQVGLKADGADTYGVVANNGSLDFVGTQNFAFTLVYNSPSILQDGYLIAKNSSTFADLQYALLLTASTGVISLILNGAGVVSTSNNRIKPNTKYSIKVQRVSGTVKIVVDEVVEVSGPNATSITSQPNIRVFARSTSANGSTVASFCKGTILFMSLHGANVTEEALTKFTDTAHKPYKATISAFRAA